MLDQMPGIMQGVERNNIKAAGLEARVTDFLEKYEEQEDGVIDDVTDAIKAVFKDGTNLPAQRRIWSGGCHYSEHHGWRDYCFTRQDWKTFDGSYFRITDGSKRFQVRQNGYWRWNQYVLSHCTISYYRMRVDGRIIFDGRTRRGNARHWRAYWGDSVTDLVWGMNA